MQIFPILALILLLYSGVVSSNQDEDNLQEIDAVLQTLLEILPGANDYTLDDSVVEGLYSVNIGSEVIYISKDGKFLIRGEILDLENSINVTEERHNMSGAAKIDRSLWIERNKAKKLMAIFVWITLLNRITTLVQCLISQEHQRFSPIRAS